MRLHIRNLVLGEYHVAKIVCVDEQVGREIIQDAQRSACSLIQAPNTRYGLEAVRVNCEDKLNDVWSVDADGIDESLFQILCALSMFNRNQDYAKNRMVVILNNRKYVPVIAAEILFRGMLPVLGT